MEGKEDRDRLRRVPLDYAVGRWSTSCRWARSGIGAKLVGSRSLHFVAAVATPATPVARSLSQRSGCLGAQPTICCSTTGRGSWTETHSRVRRPSDQRGHTHRTRPPPRNRMPPPAMQRANPEAGCQHKGTGWVGGKKKRDATSKAKEGGHDTRGVVAHLGGSRRWIGIDCAEFL